MDEITDEKVKADCKYQLDRIEQYFGQELILTAEDLNFDDIGHSQPQL